MLDSDIAALYGVETKALVQAVKRNIDRFPPDFMFQLTQAEYERLRNQYGASSSPRKPSAATNRAIIAGEIPVLRSQIVTSS